MGGQAVIRLQIYKGLFVSVINLLHKYLLTMVVPVTPEKLSKAEKKLLKAQKAASPDQPAETAANVHEVPKKEKKSKRKSSVVEEEIVIAQETSIVISNSEKSETKKDKKKKKKEKDATEKLNGEVIAAVNTSVESSPETTSKKEKKKKREKGVNVEVHTAVNASVVVSTSPNSTPKEKKKKRKKEETESSSSPSAAAALDEPEAKKPKLENNGNMENGVKVKAEDVKVDIIENQDSKSVNGVDRSEAAVEGALEKFRISELTKQQLKARGVNYLFPVQANTYNDVYDGNDLIVRARTGTGKTLSFVIPVIERLNTELSSMSSGR